MRFLKEYYKAKVSGLFQSIHNDLSYNRDDYLRTRKVESLDFTINGIQNERHYGLTEESDSRVKHIYKQGKIRNNRQWTAISESDIYEINSKMGLEKQLEPQMIGINILINGYGEILPCRIAGKSVAEKLKNHRYETLVPESSLSCRGTSGWVEKGDTISLDDNVFIFFPSGKT